MTTLSSGVPVRSKRSGSRPQSGSRLRARARKQGFRLGLGGRLLWHRGGRQALRPANADEVREAWAARPSAISWAIRGVGADIVFQIDRLARRAQLERAIGEEMLVPVRSSPRPRVASTSGWRSRYQASEKQGFGSKSQGKSLPT